MNSLKSSIISILNHHNSNNNSVRSKQQKQHSRYIIYNTLVTSLNSLQYKPQSRYLKPYIEKALECFEINHGSMFNHKEYITIKNKDILKNIIYFLSKRDQQEFDELTDIYLRI